MSRIYFAGGCFWGTEHYISQFEGVEQTEVGYANGNIPDPTYSQVYTDSTGYAECVKVTYDPETISLDTLCRLFFRSIDPISHNRQGEDCGTRYRTGIYWEDEADKMAVDKVYDEIQKKYKKPLAVEKRPLAVFYPAEEYHQEYLEKNPEGYCHLSLSTLRLARYHSDITKELRSVSDEEKRKILPRFFKTGKGEYGDGDKFIGVSVPLTRKIAMKYRDASYEVIEVLLESEWHECRLCALLMLREKYRKSPEEAVRFYLGHLKGVNNWDLVDISAPYILGDYLTQQQDRKILHQLAESENMWEQRVAIVSTLMLIRHGIYADTLELAKTFLDTGHDLMKKAVGWMLREVGKRDRSLLIDFLAEYRDRMPATMYRYATEILRREASSDDLPS